MFWYILLNVYICDSVFRRMVLLMQDKSGWCIALNKQPNYMKTNLLKLTLFLIILGGTVSCQKTYCPAYSKIVSKPMQKTTFLSDSGPKGRY